jgi:6-pyruvoyltetrahydropterin/6-carboxytetrahydropterin synthase
MKITLKKEFTFEAAHMLPNHDGKCRRLHGHSWRMRVVVEGEKTELFGPKAGMLMDYAEISRTVKPIVEDYLDHHYLNDSLRMENPTSEAIAAWLYHLIKQHISLLVAIEVDETCTSFCRYEP